MKVFTEKRLNIIIACQNKKNALEIGFNSGFSALLILLANPTIKLTCVDIGIHKYTIPCYKQIKNDFGDRIQLLIGDSRQVVPSIIDTFDFIHIDGGHAVDVAESDIINTNKLLKEKSYIVMDDVNMNDTNCSLTNLWKHYVNIYGYKKTELPLHKNYHHDVRLN